MTPGPPAGKAEKTDRATGLTPSHWIAIATIAVAVLGGVIGWALSEHNARLANVESATKNISEAQARAEGEIKAVHERLNGFDERLDRIETNIDRLIRVEKHVEGHLGNHRGHGGGWGHSRQPGSRRAGPARTRSRPA